jgi:hypothetical protein
MEESPTASPWPTRSVSMEYLKYASLGGDWRQFDDGSRTTMSKHPLGSDATVAR